MSIKDNLITLGSYVRRPLKRKLIKYSWQLKNKNGLEIGGPSSFFFPQGYFPVYSFANRIDGVNFSNETIWEGSIKEGESFRYYNKTGYQYIREATDLHGIESNKYDFLLSCHNLEHVANPFKAVKEWKRVLKPGGLLVLVLPNKEYTFDINRSYTPIEHLVMDYEQNVDEKDTTHFEEIVSSWEPGVYKAFSSREELEKQLKDNHTTRFVHHHVFNFETIRAKLEYFDFKILHEQEVTLQNLTVIAQRVH